jgi:hypothetical protein
VKALLYIPLLTILSCNSQTRQTDPKPTTDSPNHASATKSIDNSKHHTTKDTLFITIEPGDTLKYSKEEFNNIVDTHPELFRPDLEDPDPTYYYSADKKGFNSETGQDEYYVLYAHFLKQSNGINEFAERRKKLIAIYKNINSLFQRFEHGGTYFGHQSSRILGYAEYSVYLYAHFQRYFYKAYGITKQKDIYIKSLRQLIDDESGVDFEILEKEKVKRNKELNETVDKIDQAITDNFYLKRAQKFQYEHYQYN